MSQTLGFLTTTVLVNVHVANDYGVVPQATPGWYPECPADFPGGIGEGGPGSLSGGDEADQASHYPSARESQGKCNNEHTEHWCKSWGWEYIPVGPQKTEQSIQSIFQDLL